MSFSPRLRPGRDPGGTHRAAAFARCWRKLLGGMAVVALVIVPVVTPAASSAAAARPPASSAAPEMWPKLAPFKTLTVSTLGAATADQQLAAITLEGAYNQRQGPNRLYVVWNADDQTWLNDGVFKGATWTALQGQDGTGATGQLNALLADFGHDIKGAIIDNPSDSDTVNLATTMAGIDDAMVADPSQIPLLQRYGIPVLYSFANTTFSSPTAAYQWEFEHLLPKTNPRDLVILNPTAPGGLRDYIIATRSFVFYLTSTNSAEEPLMNRIISSRAPDTPIMGYIADEQPDVADLSSLGDFLNASDFLENGSDFAAEPSLPRLVQPRPEPVRATPNTVYVSYVVSEGDNAQYVEHHMFDVWSAGTDLGDVPEGWGMAPGLADYGPGMIDWYYQHLPRDSELVAGPSGVGYATQMTGTDLQKFGSLSGAFNRKDSISTVDFWENPSQIAAYARSSRVPVISLDEPYVYTQDGRTAVVGQTSSYIDSPDTLLATIEQDALADVTNKPVFLQPLVDGWALDPQNVLAISQALATWGKSVGKDFVFLTPSEMALTEEAYHQGTGGSLPALNAQAASGASLLKLPPAGSLQGFTVPTTSGPNLVANPSGQEGTAGWSDTAGTLTAGTYQGSPDITWSVAANPGTNSLDPSTSQQWVHVYPAVADGETYRFSVKVAGSGQVYMDVYNGAADNPGLAVHLSSTYQTLTWVATVPANAPTGQTGNAAQLQVREIGGIGPMTVHIKDATVQLASPEPASITPATNRSNASASSSWLSQK